MAARYKNIKPKKVLIYLGKILFSLVILYVIFKYKPIILIILFLISDIIKLTILRKKFQEFPLDLVFVFGVTISYYYNFLPSILVFILGIINRVEVAHIKDRHITKCIRHFTLFFLASLLDFYQFFTLATFLLLLNYVVKYGMAFMESDELIYTKSIGII